MKSLFRVYAFSIFIAFLAGCSDSNIPDSYHASLSGHSLSISNNKLSFDSDGGVENVTVYANNVAWRFAGLPGWLSVNPNSGSTTSSVAFTASENLSADTARTAMFYLESADAGWSFRTMISATQQAATSYITPAVKDLSFQGSGGSQTINVLSNVSWKPSSSASWAKADVSTDGKALTVSVDENPSDASRTAIITLSSASGITSSVNVTQEPAGVTGSTETLEFDKDGGAKSITISADATWEIKTSDSWISVTPSSGTAGSHMLSISVQENNSTSERAGYVYVNIGSSSKLQIPIVQKGLYIEVKPISLSFSADAESKQLEISSNTDWSITSLPDWLTTNSQSGKNSQTITLKSQVNTSASSRSGKIKIEKQGMTLSVVVDVLQEGMNLSVDNNNLQFGANASTQNVVINTYAEWTASCSEGWITLSQTSGTGKSTLSISVEENNGDNSRTGNVRIIAGELSQTITITQQGKYFNITESDKTFTSKGGTLQISFSTNDSWTASVSDNASWLTLSSTSGSGDAVINITAGDNASMKSRECAVTITPSTGQGGKVGIKQAGRYLSVSCQELYFEPMGGTSETITISTDGDAYINVSSQWITINRNVPNSITVTASQNQENSTRTGYIEIGLNDIKDNTNTPLYIIVNQRSTKINGHEYVDLGLPSGLLWATCNIGANSEEETGCYFAWGETSEKNYYASNTYAYFDFIYSQFTKYYNDSKTVLDKSDDAAYVLWGKEWRIPTMNELNELFSNCSYSKTTKKGVSGISLIGPNGNSIFLPMSGYKEGNETFTFGSAAYYWSNTLNSNNKNQARAYKINTSGYSTVDLTRWWGYSIRAVSDK